MYKESAMSAPATTKPRPEKTSEVIHSRFIAYEVKAPAGVTLDITHSQAKAETIFNQQEERGTRIYQIEPGTGFKTCIREKL